MPWKGELISKPGSSSQNVGLPLADDMGKTDSRSHGHKHPDSSFTSSPDNYQKLASQIDGKKYVKFKIYINLFFNSV